MSAEEVFDPDDFEPDLLDDDEGIDLNMGNVKSGFDPVPEGVYTLHVQKHNIKPSKNTGLKRLNVGLVIDEPEEFEGRWIWTGFGFQENELWSLQAFLEAITGEDWSEDNMKLRPKEHLYGRQVKGIVTQEPHFNEERAAAGERQNRIDKWLPVDDSAIPAEDDFDFDTPSSVGDDDVPF